MPYESRSTLKSQPPGYTFTTDKYDMFQTIFVASGKLHFCSYDTGSPVETVLTPGMFLVLRLGSHFDLESPRTGYGGCCYLHYQTREQCMQGSSFALTGSRWLEELAGLMQFLLAHPEEYDAATIRANGETMARRALFEGLRKNSRQSSERMRLAEKTIGVIRNSLYASPEEYHRRVNEIGLSYRQLSRLFREETGLSIKQFQIKERIREAKRLLEHTAFSITAIAFELHYPSSQKFAAQFKAKTGLSPREYRGSLVVGHSEN